MKHTTKKVASGEYMYRGWNIRKKVCCFSKQTEWFSSFEDITLDNYTLRDSKEEIDLYIEEDEKEKQ